MDQTKVELSEFLTYLASIPADSDQRIPPLNVLSKHLGISIATLREQLEEARSIGVVEVKQKSGIRKIPYNFTSALMPGFSYAVEANCFSFSQFSDLRRHLEMAYFIEAVQNLTKNDIGELSKLVIRAQTKLQGNPSRIPSEEHRDFHLLIYKNLNNQYLNGILQTFWTIYRISGLEVYPDLAYLNRVWQYHGRIVDLIAVMNYSQALALLVEHMDLVNQREKTLSKLNFE